MLLEHVLYQARVTATGGREGRAVSSDGVLEVRLATPRALGGAGGRGTNSEQLFAAAYAASFLSAMQYVAARDTLRIPPEITVEGTGDALLTYSLRRSPDAQDSTKPVVTLL